MIRAQKVRTQPPEMRMQHDLITKTGKLYNHEKLDSTSENKRTAQTQCLTSK